MEKFSVKVLFDDGSFTWKEVEATNFGHACMIIYEQSWNAAHISGFEKRLW